MPSKDNYHRDHPEVNKWMQSPSVQEKQRAIMRAEPGETGSPTVRHAMSGQLLRLAKRLGISPFDLAKKIPSDTVRRTKYPVIEIENDDGSRVFKHDLGIQDK